MGLEREGGTVGPREPVRVADRALFLCKPSIHLLMAGPQPCLEAGATEGAESSTARGATSPVSQCVREAALQAGMGLAERQQDPVQSCKAEAEVLARVGGHLHSRRLQGCQHSPPANSKTGIMTQ